MTIHNTPHIISVHLFMILHQLSSGVFLISMTGILFIRDIVVLEAVTSNTLVTYLYLTPNVLLRFHIHKSSFLLKSLSIWSISSHVQFCMSFSAFSIHQRYFILFLRLLVFTYQIISYILEFFISSRKGSISAASLLLMSSSFLFGIMFLLNIYLCMLLRKILSSITHSVANIKVNSMISLGISTHV